MIKKLDDINYNKPFVSQELNLRNKDQASVVIQKVNELVDVVNKLLEKEGCCK